MTKQTEKMRQAQAQLARIIPPRRPRWPVVFPASFRALARLVRNGGKRR